ncbi:hypothetical protein P7C73_g4833, partial [Tremellales sp. Uapishka_1]
MTVRDMGADSYFPSMQAYAFQTPSFETDYDNNNNNNNNNHTYKAENIDDLIYRYSSEYDRDRGTPTVGIYAQDGLWDEDESEAYTSVPTHASSRAASVSTKSASTKGRSRSATVTTMAGPDPSSSMWNWSRKTTPSAMPLGDSMVAGNVDLAPAKTIKEKKSKNRLKGKGRRGELSVVLNEPQGYPYASAPPLPATPQSFLSSSSPGLPSSPSFISPSSYPSRSNAKLDPSPLTSDSNANKSAKSTWKRGVEKILRSKSSLALREAFSSHHHNENVPPLPARVNLPQPSRNPLGHPFSSSTPPMPFVETRRGNYSSGYDPISPPPTATSESFDLNLPFDPFASSLDRSSNTLPSSSYGPGSPRLSGSPLNPPLKPKMPRHSPSLKDLKNLLPINTKAKLSKTKSMANLARDAPASAPPQQTEFFPLPKVVKKTSSMMGLSNYARPAGGIRGEAPLVAPQTRKDIVAIPAESPPLQPPQPSYFPVATPLSQRPSLLSINTGISTTSSSPGGTTAPLASPFSLSPEYAMTPPPTSPLPPLPSAGSSTQLTTTLPTRSNSGAVLLPRSKSTSMSLRAPPTSSSFFDLYEQLGIWPGKEKDEANVDATLPVEKPTNGITLAPPISSRVSDAPSAFSASSWEAAIGAFPLIDEPAPVVIESVASGIDELAVGDDSMVANNGSVENSIYTAAPTASSAAPSPTTGMSRSTSEAAQSNTTAHASGSRSRVDEPVSSLGHGVRRDGTGSGSSSRNSSRQRRPRARSVDVPIGTTAGSDSESEEDDVPLSTLHPQVLQAQQDARKIKEEKRAQRGRTRVQVGKPIKKARGEEWDGEGGVPADILSTRLEAVLELNANPRPQGGETDYPWAAAAGPSRSRVQTERSLPREGPSLPKPHQRAITEPSKSLPLQPNQSQQSSSSRQREILLQAGLRPSSASQQPGSATSSYMYPSPSAPPPQGHPHHHQSQPRRPDASRQNSLASTSRLPPAPTTSVNVTRSNTSATARSTRSRAMSVSTGRHHEENAPRAKTPTVIDRTSFSARAYVGGLEGKKVVLELYPETTAKDVLDMSRGDLAGLPHGVLWVLCEVFGEMGCQRQIREYESVQSIVKGWDPNAKFNCFVYTQSHRGIPTLARAIPATAPFYGAYVQWERKGKWSKRWLETRGGQVFLAKNEKNKDEIHINSSFFDVYTTTRPHKSPKPFVFIVKRMEPAASFENSDEYSFTFCADDSTAWKLLSAIYDARSHNLAQSQPNLLLPVPAVQAKSVERKPTIHQSVQPLVDIKADTRDRSGFTGRGLLKI